MFKKRSHQLLWSLCKAFSSNFSSVSALTHGLTFSSVAPIVGVVGVTRVVNRSSSELSLRPSLNSSSGLSLKANCPVGATSWVVSSSGLASWVPLLGSCITSSFPLDLVGVRDG
jgi:hypothetical protein